MASILVIEDHLVFGKALVRLLTEKANVEVVDVLRTGEEALEKLPSLHVDLVLIDVSLPTINGIQLVSMIHHQFPGLPCLMLSGHLTPFYVKRSLEAGARGYVLKDDIPGVLEGVERVLGGEIYVSSALREQGM
ncbi:MAG TPA: response regulator transcription factor [Anaerolineales bacterium]|jgi:DNA-binding NarL/FixJ family response regulator|nr:response regulator transcription factor [Anaerolineales bacterium]